MYFGWRPIIITGQGLSLLDIRERNLAGGEGELGPGANRE